MMHLMSKPQAKSERRTLRFESLDDILADAERAVTEGYRTIAEWTLGQQLRHIAILMNASIDGFRFNVPLPMQWFVRLFMKRRMLERGLPSGIKLKGDVRRMLYPHECTDQEGLDELRTAIHRLKTETQREPSPIFGPLDREQWRQFHCRHAELHLSFAIPAKSSTPASA